MTTTLGVLVGVLAVTQTVVVALFLLARDRQEQRHLMLLQVVEEQRRQERTELLQRIQAPADAAVQYAPYEPPVEPQHVSVFDDEKLMETLGGASG